MRSLKKRLSLGLGFILLLVFIGQWATLHYAIGKVAKDQVVKHLEHDGTTLLQATEIAPDGVVTINEFFVEEVYRRPYSGHYLVVFLDGKQVYASPSLGNQTLETAAVPPGAQIARESTGPNGQHVLTLAQGHRVKNHEVSITAGEVLDDIHAEINHESLSSLWLILPLLFGTVVVVGFTIRRELSLLSGVQNQLRGVRHGDVGRIHGDVPVEIRPLVDEVNRLLELMQRRLQQSRTGVGNLAHAIKTPLAVLFRLADEPLLPPEQRNILKTQSTAIRDRVELELKRARLAGVGRAGAHTNMRAELEDMIKVLTSIYREKNLAITYEAPEKPVPYDREDMLELLGNLSDNACKWAKRRVLINAKETEGGGLRLYVADDGPGCTEEVATVIKQRGVRLDESTPGHGLGLAICKDIVQYYGGRMDIGRDRIMGGLSVEIELPGQK